MRGADVTARGLALRALDTWRETRDGAVNIDARPETTAAGLEALASQYSALLGVAGETHVVETAPYLTRNKLVIRGNGAQLRNANATPLSSDDTQQTVLPLGTSNVWASDALSYFSVLSTSGTVLSLATGDGDRFTADDLVIVRGATKYFVAGDDYNVYRNYTRARVVSATESTVELDRMLPSELLADSPVIANAGEGIWAGFDGPPHYYMLYAPHVSNLTLVSEVGDSMRWGGVIDGTFRDLILDGRNGIGFNAMQDCLFENIRFRGWRKICELSEGSYGTTVRNVRGTLADASTKLGGGDDTGPFFIGVQENAAHCLLEDFVVDSGPNNATSGNAIILGSGHNNEIRNSVFRLPAHTGTALSIQANSTPGNENIDCGFRNVTVFQPNGAAFFAVAGGIRAYLEQMRFFGSVSGHAGVIVGSEGRLIDVWCEDGSLLFNGTCDNWRIENCYFPQGFANLTRDRLANNAIRNNESDASRRIAAAAKANGGQVGISETAANTVYTAATMTIAAGDLDVLDEVHFRLSGSVDNTANNHHVRITCTTDAANPFEIAHFQTSNALDSWAISGVIEVMTNATVHCSATVSGSAGTSCDDTRDSNGDLDANGLQIAVEIWTETSGKVFLQSYAIAGQKAGMKNVPVLR